MRIVFHISTLIFLLLPLWCSDEIVSDSKIPSFLAKFEKDATKWPSPPLIIHIGHTITQDNMEPIQTRIQATTQLVSLYDKYAHNFKSYFFRPFPLITASALFFILYKWFSLASLYKKLIHNSIWTNLFLQQRLCEEDNEIIIKQCSEKEFVKYECLDYYAHYASHLIFRRALHDVLEEKKNLKKFCSLFKLMQFVGAGFVFCDYKEIYTCEKDLEEFLNKIMHVIASFRAARCFKTMKDTIK